MLLGAAKLLGHELGIFTELQDAKFREHRTIADNVRRIKLQKLLYIYLTLVAARLGVHLMLLLTCNESALSKLKTPTTKILEAWIDLIKISKAVSYARKVISS
jgi:hypothetical protein